MGTHQISVPLELVVEALAQIPLTPLCCKECLKPLHYCHGDKVFDCCWCGRVVTVEKLAETIAALMDSFQGKASYFAVVGLGANAYELPPSDLPEDGR